MWRRTRTARAAAPSTRAPLGTGLRRQPEEAEAYRGVLRLVEGHRAAAQAQTSRTVQRGVNPHLRGDALQPGAEAKTDPDSVCGLNGADVSSTGRKNRS